MIPNASCSHLPTFQRCTFPHFIYAMLPKTKRIQMLDPQKRIEQWWRVIGRTLSAFLTRSSHPFFKTSVAPSLGSFSDEHFSLTPPVSCVCNDNTPTETDRVSKSTGETSAQHASGALSSIDGSPIPPQLDLFTLENLAVAGQHQGSDLSWTHNHTQLLRYPSRLVPDELELGSQSFVRT